MNEAIDCDRLRGGGQRPHRDLLKRRIPAYRRGLAQLSAPLPEKACPLALMGVSG
jgi:hypothetical protein